MKENYSHLPNDVPLDTELNGNENSVRISHLLHAKYEEASEPTHPISHPRTLTDSDITFDSVNDLTTSTELKHQDAKEVIDNSTEWLETLNKKGRLAKFMARNAIAWHQQTIDSHSALAEASQDPQLVIGQEFKSFLTTKVKEENPNPVALDLLNTTHGDEHVLATEFSSRKQSIIEASQTVEANYSSWVDQTIDSMDVSEELAKQLRKSARLLTHVELFDPLLRNNKSPDTISDDVRVLYVDGTLNQDEINTTVLNTLRDWLTEDATLLQQNSNTKSESTASSTDTQLAKELDIFTEALNSPDLSASAYSYLSTEKDDAEITQALLQGSSVDGMTKSLSEKLAHLELNQIKTMISLRRTLNEDGKTPLSVVDQLLEETIDNRYSTK